MNDLWYGFKFSVQHQILLLIKNKGNSFEQLIFVLCVKT